MNTTTDALREELESAYWRYVEHVRPSIWNNPNAKLEAGRCLTMADPWHEYNTSAPKEGRGIGYWRDVASWIFSALTINGAA